jgi:hypothetical protein
MSEEVRVRPRILPHGVIDLFTVVLVSPILLGIVFGIPAFVSWLLTDSTLATALVVAGMFVAFLLFTVWHLELSSEGIRFHRILGTPKFLPWNRVVSVSQAPRWELILRGWFWPPFPAREMTTSLTSVGHYRIQWDSDFCYFPPANPSAFECFVERRLQTEPSNRPTLTMNTPSPYRGAIKLALAQQCTVLVLASMILDGGDIFNICLIAFIAFWAVVGFIRWRRPHAPTKLDLIFIQASYLLLCILTFFLVNFFWKGRGIPGLL